MSISAAQVKELRERSGAAMMDCKRALEATGGDIDAALEKMRKDGQAKADKKAGRLAADGVVKFAVSEDGQRAAIVEFNCETDFVAKGDEFQALAQAAADAALATGAESPQALESADIGGITLDEKRRELVARLGENMSLRRVLHISGAQVHAYSHGGRIGVLVATEGGDAELGRQLAMHVAGHDPAPQYVEAGEVPVEVQDREREILIAQAENSGKPREIIEKMVEGRLRKFLGEITLLGQAFVMDPDTTVGKLLGARGASVTGFARLEVGEGIVREESNFADEVMAQAREAAGA